MKSGKRDILLMLCIVFAITGGILISYAAMQPKVYDEEGSSTVPELVLTQEADSTEASVTSAPTAKPSTVKDTTSATSAQVKYPLNINTATAEELMTIDGIGERRAYSIIDYREHIGGYTSVEQIKDIHGIGESIYNSIAGYLTV